MSHFHTIEFLVLHSQYQDFIFKKLYICNSKNFKISHCIHTLVTMHFACCKELLWPHGL